MQKLLAVRLTGDNASFELFDKQFRRFTQLTGIEIQDEIQCGLETLHMQDDMLRHHLIIHANGLDACSKVREEVQDRAREAAGGVAPMQTGAVNGMGKKGKNVKGKGKGG